MIMIVSIPIGIMIIPIITMIPMVMLIMNESMIMTGMMLHKHHRVPRVAPGATHETARWAGAGGQRGFSRGNVCTFQLNNTITQQHYNSATL